MRADALRNRKRILDAAEEIFAREGLAVPVDAVAEAAGVGVGTLYRHFPTKEALFEAIVYDRLVELVEATKVGLDQDPGPAFFAFLDEMSDQITLKHDLFDALSAAGVDVKSRCGELMQELELGIEALRQRAVAAGAVRDDIGTQEVMGLVIGACLAADHMKMDELGSGQILQVVYDGLRPRSPDRA
jgi:AcrR family transcriptional regulator